VIHERKREMREKERERDGKQEKEKDRERMKRRRETEEGHYGVDTSSRLLQIIGLFAEYSLFYRALLQRRPIILKSLLIVATP